MIKTIFKISKMDCPSEEQIIRMKLEDLENIHSLEFDIPNRLLVVHHTENYSTIFNRLNELKFDTSLLSTESLEDFTPKEKQKFEKKTLWLVLIINFSFFLIELITGLISQSMGLIADSLDMLADSLVYALALFAVGGSIIRKKNIAKIAAYFQIILAVIGFVEVLRRFLGFEQIPDFQTMIVISFFALIANIICLLLLQKNRSKEAHIQASMIFTSNDIIINSGVIIAGILVNILNSSYPDLIIGSIVFLIVAKGAYSILQLSK